MNVSEGEISRRVRALMAVKGFKIKPLALAAGIDPTQLSRMLRAVRQWTIPHLQAVAKVLDAQVGDFTDELIIIPIVAEIGAATDTPYPDQIDKTQTLGEVPAPRFWMLGKGKVMLSQMYALIIKDDSFEPTIPKGSKLIVEKDGDKEEGNLVVFCNSDNHIRLGRISFQENHIILQSMKIGGKPMILPRKYLSSMDRVIGQMFI